METLTLFCYRAAKFGDLWLRIPNVKMEWFVDRNKSKRVSFVFSDETSLIGVAYDKLDAD